MPRPEQVMIVVREWVAKAENDLKNAVNTVKMGDECPTDTVCFHAQQCVEKYLKALLVWNGIPFPKLHNIAALMELLPSEHRIAIPEEEQELLNDYAVVTRYPGDYEDISLAEARAAVRIARRVRKDARTLLPKEALPPRRKNIKRRPVRG